MEWTQEIHDAENVFRMGNALAMTGNAPRAVEKLREACEKMEKVIMTQEKVPSSHVVLIQALTLLGECHEKMREIDKALIFYRAKTSLLEFLAAHPELRVQDELFLVPQASCEAREKMEKLFEDVHSGFELESESFKEEDARRMADAFRQEYEREQILKAKEQAQEWRELAKAMENNRSTIDKICSFCESRLFLILVGIFGLVIAILPLVYIALADSTPVTREPVPVRSRSTPSDLADDLNYIRDFIAQHKEQG